MAGIYRSIIASGKRHCQWALRVNLTNLTWALPTAQVDQVSDLIRSPENDLEYDEQVENLSLRNVGSAH